MNAPGIALAAWWATVFTAVAAALWLSSRREKRAEQTRAAHARDRINSFEESQRIAAECLAIWDATLRQQTRKGQ